jgi:prophage regulatory protein
MSIRLLKMRDVVQKVGLSKSQILRMERAGTFPSAILISTRARRWLEGEVDVWVEERVRESRGTHNFGKYLN